MDRLSEKQEALFQEFAWQGKKSGLSHDAIFNETVLGVSGGVSVVLKMIEASELRAEGDEVPLFSKYDAGRLLRYAIRSLDLLTCEAEERIKE